MRILYLAPRYHTNQTAIMRGWKTHGDDIKFISYYTAPIEDYSDLKPVVLGFTRWYKMFYFFYVEILCRKKRTALDNKLKFGYPPVSRLRKEILDFNPDIAILRERTVYSMKAYEICRKHDIPCILYNQNPLWDDAPKSDNKHKYVFAHTPQIRMTPVYGLEKAGKTVQPGSYYIPFAIDPKLAPEKREYFAGDRINILCVGKFEPRKHHIMLMDVLSRIKDEKGIDFHLIIVGEATGRFQKEYYQKVEDYYNEKEYKSFVELKTNVSRDEMAVLYAGTDVFVIPSTLEMASVSQLEAMSYSVPVICSDTNGTSCYVENGRDGYLFKDCDSDDLYDKLVKMLDSRSGIRQMGRFAYEDVISKYLFRNYYDGIMKILNDNFKKQTHDRMGG